MHAALKHPYFFSIQFQRNVGIKNKIICVAFPKSEIKSYNLKQSSVSRLPNQLNKIHNYHSQVLKSSDAPSKTENKCTGK